MRQKHERKPTGPLPPYISFKTLTGFVQKLKETAIPGQIDSSVLRNYAGSVARQLVLALKYLGLIEANGITTDKLKKLVHAYGTPTWKDQLGEIVTEAYLSLTQNLDIDNGTQKQLQDAFRSAGVSDGVVLQRAVTFYLSGLREAGMTFSPHFTDRQRRPKAEKPRKTKTENADNGSAEYVDITSNRELSATARFNFPIPGKPSAMILVPAELSNDDWEMISSMVKAYINRRAKGQVTSL